MADNDGQWERGLIEKLATAALKEQRRTRLWGIFWKLLTFTYITVIILLAVDWKGGDSKGGKHTALVEISGVIAPGTDASAEKVASVFTIRSGRTISRYVPPIPISQPSSLRQT